MKELTLDEISLLEEMKSNCLKKGQYIDEKAKDKFNMLCHLEDFGIAYYELLDVIKEAIEYIETHQLNFKKGTTTFGSERLSMEERKLLDILRGVDKE